MPPHDGPPIALHRLIFLPLAFLFGFFAGIFVGAVYLPYLLLGELVRKIGQSWPYLDGWADWAEKGGAGRQKPGWMIVWVAWLIAYVISMFTWGPLVGMICGPFIAAYIVIVPDGLQRLYRVVGHGITRFRRLQIKIVDPDRERAA